MISSFNKNAVSPAQSSAAASKAEVSPEVLLEDKTNNCWHCSH